MSKHVAKLAVYRGKVQRKQLLVAHYSGSLSTISPFARRQQAGAEWQTNPSL